MDADAGGRGRRSQRPLCPQAARALSPRRPARATRPRRGVERTARPTHTDAAGVRRNRRGWECVHIAIDDCTRLAYAEVLSDEKATTVAAFLRRAIAFFHRHGMRVQQLLTDNGSAYRSAI